MKGKTRTYKIQERDTGKGETAGRRRQENTGETKEKRRSEGQK